MNNEPSLLCGDRVDVLDGLHKKHLIEAGKVCPAIDRTCPLSEGTQAVRYVGSSQARAKVVITM